MMKEPLVRFYWQEMIERRLSPERTRYLLLEWAQIKERFDRWGVFRAHRLLGGEEGGSSFLSFENFASWRKENLFIDLPEVYEASDIYPALHIDYRKRLNEPLDRSVSELVFLRAMEPGVRQAWAAFHENVRMAFEGGLRSGLGASGDRLLPLSAATNLDPALEPGTVQGAGPIGRSIAIGSSLVVYADIFFRWRELKSLESLVKKTAKEILFLEEE